MKNRIVSGMRSTGKLHLGHYLGVIQNWVKLQKDYESYFFVADWHALTTKFDKTETLRQDVNDVVIDWLASGIDPEVSTIYVQSLIPEIAELHVYLSMVTPQNWVERDPTLKDMAKALRIKAGASADSEEANKELLNSQISYGLMGYPVLMSADIMALNAQCVPVGIDQVAHIEITRDIARRFNNIYKTDFFNEPQPILNECSLICGLDGNKMGKSFNNDIKISDSEEVTTKKIMTAITDTNRVRKDDLGTPENCLVAFKYWEIFGNSDEIALTDKECRTAARGCAQCKRELARVINEKFAPIREKRRYYEAHPEIVKEIIHTGSAHARGKIQEVVGEVREIIGMWK